jgi:hypothetical protein
MIINGMIEAWLRDEPHRYPKLDEIDARLTVDTSPHGLFDGPDRS